MKNKIYATLSKLCIVIGTCFLFASFSPSLDGRAVVVDEGVFPQGLFAKTVGYLPGDIISVANITGDATVDILVIGALDPSEGVAIMLTPEAAAAIGIEKDSNNIVKITKRSGQDERVYGTAVIAKTESYGKKEENKEAEYETEVLPESQEIIEESIAEPFTEEIIETPVEMPVEEETEEVVQEPAEQVEESYEELVEEPVVQPVEEPVEENYEEPFEEEAISEAPAYETIEATPVEENQESEVEPEYVEEYTEEPLPPALESPVEEEVVLTPVEEEKFDEEVYSEEPLKEVEKTEEPESGEYFEDEGIDDLPQETNILNEEIETEDFQAEPEESFEEPLNELNEVLPVSEPVKEAEVPVVEEYIDDQEFEDLPEGTPMEEYEAIVLVPTDANPPVAEKVPEVEQALPVEEDEVELVNEPAVVIAEPEPVVEVPVTSSIIEKYLVSDAKDLKKGYYYIQIASMNDDANIIEIIEKYGKNYPFVVLPKSNGKTKQILVGPLTVDEYKVVLERFKSYGYKDAFLRKIK